MPTRDPIAAYHASLAPSDRRIGEALRSAIDRGLPGADSMIWHAHPVWFLDGNPIVGYSRLKDAIRLMFWSGQSFDESGLVSEPPGTKFKSAGVRFRSVEEINSTDLKRWLRKAAEIQWDYKNIVKRKGKLVRLK